MLTTTFVLPLVLLILSMVLGILRPGTTSPAILLTPSLYGPGSISFMHSTEDKVSTSIKKPPGIGTTCMQEFSSIVDFTKCMTKDTNMTTILNENYCTCSFMNWKCEESRSGGYFTQKWYTNTTDIIFELPEIVLPNKWILETHYQYISEQYGGWKLSNNISIVYYNNKGFHSSASYLNALNNARLRSQLNEEQQSEEFGITIYNHPFRSTRGQVLGQSIQQHISDYTLALFVLTAVSFVPASSIIYLIQERTSEEKFVLRTFNVGPILYWTANLFWDFIISIIFVIFSAAIIKIFNISSLSQDLNFWATLTLFVSYCLSINSFVYLFEKCFTEASFGQVILFTGCIFTGVLTLIIMLLLYMFWWIKSLADARKILEILLLILPPYAFGGGLLDLITNQLSADLFQQFGEENSNYSNPFDWKITGKNIFFLVAHILIFFAINVLHEKIHDSKNTHELSNHHIMILENVTKKYYNNFKEFNAVKEINMKIGKGECYGLIGLNGAGKSTTFKMITGLLVPTSGTITFSCKRLGYCPQNNSLDDYITVSTHLKVYAKIAGYKTSEIEIVTDWLMKEFTLDPYKSVQCGSLSGGNKRKLCAATSMLGQPELILMDEPTSGMDPTSRRLVWRNIGKAVKKGQSVLLTSHSLQECDTLCDNISIMAGGSVVCSGSPGFLKEKFGKGYRVNVKMCKGASFEEINEHIMNKFPESIFLESKHYWIKYNVRGKMSSLLELLVKAKSKKLIDSFTLDITSLEDIFLEVTSKANLGVELNNSCIDEENTKL